MILLDTNVVSAIMRIGREPAVERWLNRQDVSDLYTSAPTIFEIRYGIEMLPNGRRRRALEDALHEILSEALLDRILPFDAPAAARAAQAKAMRGKAGPEPDIPDSQIAGIALSLGAAVATRNTKDFTALGLHLIDPWAS